MTRTYKTEPDWYCDRCGRPLWADRSKWRWVETSFRWEACEKCAREFDAVIRAYEKPMRDRQKALWAAATSTRTDCPLRSLD